MYAKLKLKSEQFKLTCEQFKLTSEQFKLKLKSEKFKLTASRRPRLAVSLNFSFRLTYCTFTDIYVLQLLRLSSEDVNVQ